MNLPRVSPRTEAKALVGGSVMLFTQGQVAQAREWLTRALTLAPDIDADVLAMAEILFGHVEQSGGQLEAARQRFRPASISSERSRLRGASAMR
jgi:Tfp pilus assembly protein PilF